MMEPTKKHIFFQRACDFGPVFLGVSALWVKLVFFSLSLRNVWWAPETSLGEWLIAHVDILNMTAATVLILFAPIIVLPRVWGFVLVLAVDLVVSTLIVTNNMHFRYFGNIMPFSQVSSVRNVTYVLPSILLQLRLVDIAYYIDIVVGILIVPFYRISCQHVPSLERNVRLRICCRSMLVGALVATPTLRMLSQGKDLLFAYTNLQREVVATVGLVPYYLGDAIFHARSRLHGIAQADRSHALRFVMNQRYQNRGSQSNFFGIARHRNVIMIMAESLQAFPIGLKINGQLIAPRISTFAQESLNFVNFYDQTNLATTSDGEFTSLQSLHPLSAGSVGGRYPQTKFYALPELLSAHGYTTLSACGESGTMWSMNKMHPRLGFQQSLFQEQYQIREHIGEWMADDDFFTQTLAILKAQKTPFLAYMITSSNHHPFEIPRKFRVLDLGELEGTYEGNYLHSVHYFDQAFGNLIDLLKNNELLDESVVVLYGDHQAYLDGTKLADHLGLGQMSSYDSFRLRKRVPFLIRLPKGLAAGPRSTTGGHLDIAPTILSLLGVLNDDIVMFGKDLTQGQDSFVVFRDGSFADGTHLFINGFGATSAVHCYEMKSGRQIDCGRLEKRTRSAAEQLEISDLIIRGNLIPFLMAARRMKSD